MNSFVLGLIVFLAPLFIQAKESKLELGKAIYEETCISCHGKNGETNPEMKLVVMPRKLNKTILTQDQSFQIIKYGARHWGAHAEMMPAFESVYSDEQIYAVASYISQKFNPNRTQKIQKLMDESNSLTLEDEKKILQVGEKIFKRRCSWCHGVKGDGQSKYVEASKENKDLIYPYNLTRTLLDEDQIFLYAKFGGHYWGTAKTDMPAWKRKYNDIQLKSVAHFIEEQIKNLK